MDLSLVIVIILCAVVIVSLIVFFYRFNRKEDRFNDKYYNDSQKLEDEVNYLLKYYYPNLKDSLEVSTDLIAKTIEKNVPYNVSVVYQDSGKKHFINLRPQYEPRINPSEFRNSIKIWLKSDLINSLGENGILSGDGEIVATILSWYYIYGTDRKIYSLCDIDCDGKWDYYNNSNEHHMYFTSSELDIPDMTPFFDYGVVGKNKRRVFIDDGKTLSEIIDDIEEL